MKPIACWHHADENRLSKHLRCGRIDLYGRNEVTAKGTNRLNHWWGKMRLKKGDRIRIVVAGHVYAFATIASGPYDLPINEVCGEWGSAVSLENIDELVAPLQTASCAHLQGSHRFDGPKTSLLDC
jgi:hypothetical protein